MKVHTPAQAGECFFLDEAEELGLDSGWNVADFVQESVPPAARSRCPGRIAAAPVKAFFS